ncbi:MAG: single-stranded-DNA-specific exonuclease RecJ [Thermodesulfovibrionales bacterium]
MHRRWLVNRTNREFIQYLSAAASVSPVFAQVLINRGLKTPAEIRAFLDSGLTALSDPYDIPDMDRAAARIKAAVKQGETVLVHGDYDADGLTATAILVSALVRLGADVRYFIPHRIEHGYGFNAPGVRAAVACGAGLIITVDCGITSFEAVRAAREAGIDVIITDHHEPERKTGAENVTRDAPRSTDFLIPEAAATVNPKLRADRPELGKLSGAGVAFKLCQALSLDPDLGYAADEACRLLDLATIGTVADVVPVTGENRILLKQGLGLIANSTRPALRLLRQISGAGGRDVSSSLLSYTIAPRLNAAGRMGHAQDVVRLLVTEDEAEAGRLAEWIDRMNTERQKVEGTVFEMASEQLDAVRGAPVIVLSGEGWHPGVVGIVAARISEECFRPTFALSIEDGIAKGSGRSIPDFDLYEGLSACSDLLLGFGGHRQAAGLRLRATDIPAFRERICSVAAAALAETDLTPLLEIDADLTFAEITPSLVRELETLAPLGYGNPEPVLGAKGLEVVTPRIVGKNHLKMRLRQRNSSLDTIGFDMGRDMEHLLSFLTVDAAFTPSFNDWNGNRLLQLVLKGFRPAR